MKKVLVTSKHNFDVEVHRYLFDNNFLKNLKNSITFFDLVYELINNCQKSTNSIADAAELWSDLSNKILSGF